MLADAVCSRCPPPIVPIREPQIPWKWLYRQTLGALRKPAPGAASLFALSLSPTAGTVHCRQCFVCGLLPVAGTLYKCFHCRAWYACEACFLRVRAGGLHEDGHLFVKIREPRATAAPLLYYQFPKVRGRVHKAVCSACGCSPLAGSRFKCSRCPDFSLCEGCWGRARAPGEQRRLQPAMPHAPDHPFFEVQPRPLRQQCRRRLQRGQILFQEKRHEAHDSPTWCDSCTRPIVGMRFKCLNCA